MPFPIENSPDILSGEDLFEALRKTRLPVFSYGTGNGADKLFAAAAEKGIPIAGIFVSDDFARGQTFHGLPVSSYSEFAAKHPAGSAVVLTAFGSALPDVIERVKKIAERYPLFVPDFPVCGDGLFDTAFVKAHESEFAAAQELFFDEASRSLFNAVVRAKRTGDFAALLAAVREETPLDILEKNGFAPHVMGDFGAYDGDSAREALARFPLRKITAVEPDPRNFRKLQAMEKEFPELDLTLCNAALSDREGEAPFDASGNRNAGLYTGKGTAKTRTVTAEMLFCGCDADYLKYDVEGAEKEGLLGAKKLISRARPAVTVALYHRREDLFALPLLLAKDTPRYRFFLTRKRSFPMWDVDLVAIPVEKCKKVR